MVQREVNHGSISPCWSEVDQRPQFRPQEQMLCPGSPHPPPSGGLRIWVQHTPRQVK